MKLTAAKVRSLTKPGRYGDGGTLHLVVAPGGSKSWVQRIAIDGRRRDIGLGGWPVVGLAKARQRAFANRVAVSDGRNPLAEKRKDSDANYVAALSADGAGITGRRVAGVGKVVLITVLRPGR